MAASHWRRVTVFAMTNATIKRSWKSVKRSSKSTVETSAACVALAESIADAVPRDGKVEPVAGLFLHRVSRAGERVYAASEPSLCVVASGAKEVAVGDETLHYNPAHYLLTTIGLPVVGRAVDPTPRRPHLGLRLRLDPAAIGPLAPDLPDAVLRLARLATSGGDDHRILAPLVTREIVYRLARGRQAGRLRHLAGYGSKARRVADVADAVRQAFDRPLSVPELAKRAGMSLSGFHAHFKAATTMSPLQYQKRLRLHEARRLMLAESLDAGEAGHRVGYEDASHFSRDDRRHFGESPIRDVEHLRRRVAA